MKVGNLAASDLSKFYLGSFDMLYVSRRRNGIWKSFYPK